MQFRVATVLSDPAFSPDPHSNPYFASNDQPAWAFSPPLGHPVLKRRNPKQPSIFAHSVSPNDLDLQLIQPPNSPDIPQSATQTASSVPFLNHPSPPPAQAQSEAEPLKQPLRYPAATDLDPSPPLLEQGKQEKKKRRMPFLTRRKSSNPPPSAPLPPKVQDTKQQIRTSVPSDATRQLLSIPGHNILGSTSQPGDPRLTSARSAISGASTPTSRSVITTRSGVPSQNASARSQDLDRIDELDETNPWGIPLHHRGPYEAAVQAMRNASNPMSLGQGSNMLNDYPRQGLYGQENVYVPPQVPMGVSLNLSPGQILPRNLVMPPPRYPRRQATIDSPPTRMPANYLASPPALRRQSQPVQPMPPFPDAHRVMTMLSHDPLPPAPVPQPQPPSQIHRQSRQPRSELKADKPDILPFDIGMAMLGSEVPESSNPSNYLQPETMNGSEFDPYDPIHLENAHSRTPSPLVHEPSPGRSREPTPDPLTERLIPQPTVFRKMAELPDSLRPGFNKVPDATVSKVDTLSVPAKQWPASQPQDQSQSHSRNHSPLPPPSAASYVDLGRNNSNSSLVLDTSAAEVKTFAVNNPIPPQLPKEELPEPQNPLSRNIPAPVHLGPPVAQDYDARSTNQSISTYTSSQVRNGRPPPHRRVPKHLVMPAPLNPATNNPARFQQTQTQQTFPPTKVQVQIRAQSHIPYSAGPQMLEPFAPKLVSQEKQVATGGKLRKRLSTKFSPSKVTNIPSAPINVSFAPPVIGYGSPPSIELGSNPNKISKRLLSKRRTDL